jgi:Putative inner membrane protein (DUF1819)
MNLKAKPKAKTKHKDMVPAFGERPYVARLSSRSALVSELKILLAAGSDIPRVDEYKRLVLEENCLAKATMSSRQRALADLRSRYILELDDPLFQCFLAEWSKQLPDPEGSLTIYCLWALNDRLVAELGTKYLFPRLRQAPSPVKTDDIMAYLFTKQTRHPELVKWSAETTSAVARKYAASIRDFGLARGIYSKLSVHPALYAAPARFLVRALRLANTKDLDIIRSPWFRLIGLDSHEVVDALSELRRQGKLSFNIQADVVELGLEGHRP